MKTRHFCAVALWMILACGPAFGDAQTPQAPPTAPSDSAQTTAAEQSAKAEEPKKGGEFTFAPIPVIDPTIGNGLALGVLYTVPLNADDKVSPPSVFGVGGLRTSNGTWGVALGAKLYLREDRFRILLSGVTARVNYAFYGIGNEQRGITIPIHQSGSGFLTGALVRVFKRWYVGGRYFYSKVDTGASLSEDDVPPALQEVQATLPVAALGLHVQRDTRASQFYPRSGSVLDTKLNFSSASVGALFTYQDYEATFEQFFRLSQRQVLAYHVKACAVDGHAPFFALCSLGNASDMRGYPVGRYRDRRMFVGQAEYRREIWWRFGVVAFAGAGEVASTFSDFSVSDTHPGGGAGLRFNLSPKNHINLRIDYGVGQGSHGWYVGIGEAF